jgi:hypothetical protein
MWPTNNLKKSSLRKNSKKQRNASFLSMKRVDLALVRNNGVDVQLRAIKEPVRNQEFLTFSEIKLELNEMVTFKVNESLGELVGQVVESDYINSSGIHQIITSVKSFSVKTIFKMKYSSPEQERLFLEYLNKF